MREMNECLRTLDRALDRRAPFFLIDRGTGVAQASLLFVAWLTSPAHGDRGFALFIAIGLNPIIEFLHPSRCSVELRPPW
jgi:hypothetical protein